jgi:hypothetical protein
MATEGTLQKVLVTMQSNAEQMQRIAEQVQRIADQLDAAAALQPLLGHESLGIHGEDDRMGRGASILERVREHRAERDRRQVCHYWQY